MKTFKSCYGTVEAPNNYKAIGKTMEQFVIPIHRRDRDRNVGRTQYSITDLDEISDTSTIAICYAGNYFISPKGLGYMFLIEEVKENAVCL
jgi:hypothetical protein